MFDRDPLSTSKYSPRNRLKKLFEEMDAEAEVATKALQQQLAKDEIIRRNRLEFWRGFVLVFVLFALVSFFVTVIVSSPDRIHQNNHRYVEGSGK